ncbi:MAG: flagellar hook assembly protein FlgD [Bdellovibrionales bacterium]
MTAVTDATSIISSYNASQTSAASTSSAADAAQSTLIGNYDTFLKILTTQLENQDPTDPVDASEFTNQLVMYSQVEQQIATNDKLEDVLSIMGSNSIKPLLSYLGQYTESKAGNELVVQDGTSLLSYDLPEEAQSVTLYIQDEDGDVVATVDAPTDSGMHRIAWDGTLDAGGTAEDGAYRFIISAVDSSGNTIDLDDVRVIGKVTSIETDEDGNISLMVGDLELSDEDILSVFSSIGTTDSSSTASTEEETATSETT